MSKSPIGREFSEIVMERAARETMFVAALLEQAVERLLSGDLPTARSLLRDVIKGAIGYSELSRRTGTPEKSLIRMFGPTGNPTAANLASVLKQLQRNSQLRLRVHSELVTGRGAGRNSQRSGRGVAE